MRILFIECGKTALFLFVSFYFYQVKAKPCHNASLPQETLRVKSVHKSNNCTIFPQPHQYLKMLYTSKLYHNCEILDEKESMIVQPRQKRLYPKAWLGGLFPKTVPVTSIASQHNLTMCVGEKRRIVAGSDWAYKDSFRRGSSGVVAVPNSTIIWDLTLLEILDSEQNDNGDENHAIPPPEFLQQIFRSSRKKDKDSVDIIPLGSPLAAFHKARDAWDMARDAAHADPIWASKEENKRLLKELKSSFEEEKQKS